MCFGCQLCCSSLYHRQQMLSCPPVIPFFLLTPCPIPVTCYVCVLWLLLMFSLILLTALLLINGGGGGGGLFSGIAFKLI